MKFLIVFALFTLAAANEPHLPRPPPENKWDIIREKLEWIRDLVNRPVHIGAEPVDIYEPIQIGPAAIDFDPNRPSPGSIDKERIREALRRILDLIVGIWPRDVHVGAEPIDGPVSAERPPRDILAVLRQIRDRILGIWPNDVPRPPRPSVGSLEAFKTWLQILIQALENPVTIEPVIVDNFEPASPIPAPVSSPLVQIIVNVQGSENSAVTSPVAVEGLDHPSPVQVIEA